MFFTPLVYASGYLVLVFLAICMVCTVWRRNDRNENEAALLGTEQHSDYIVLVVSTTQNIYHTHTHLTNNNNTQACGLYYMAELAEEYSRLTKKILTHCIQGVIAIHVLLLVCESEYISYVCARLFVCSRVCVFVCVCACLCVRGFYIIHAHADTFIYIYVHIPSCYTYGVYIITYNAIQTPNKHTHTHTHTHVWCAHRCMLLTPALYLPHLVSCI